MSATAPAAGVGRGPSTGLGSVWDKYNVIAACGRIGNRCLRIPKRSIALVVFTISGLLSLIFFALWIATDQISTWQWTQFLGGSASIELERLTYSEIASVGFAILALQFAILVVSWVPTLMEILAPFFADQDDVLSAVFVAFAAFDFYTDWPKAAEVAAAGDFTGWGPAASLGIWMWTVLLAFFFSLIVQYVLCLFAWSTLCCAWNIVLGPSK